MAVPIRRDSREYESKIALHTSALAAHYHVLHDLTTTVLRIVAGLLLIPHGLEKHFGMFMSAQMPPWRAAPAIFSQMWFAGTLELVGGILLTIGLFTRPVAFVLAGEMAFAYFMVHAPRAVMPIQNMGELAVIYCFVFLTFAATGGGPYSVDGLFKRARYRGAPNQEVERSDQTSQSTSTPPSMASPTRRREDRKARKPDSSR